MYESDELGWGKLIIELGDSQMTNNAKRQESSNSPIPQNVRHFCLVIIPTARNERE